MAHISIDLMDGKPPVSFSLKTEDTERFVRFMAEYAELREVIDKAHERLENIVAAGAIPMPDSVRVVALGQCLESLRDDLEPFISHEPDGV